MAANLASSDLPLANPVWGALPVEQYLIQNWSDESPTPPASQRHALLRRLAFEHDALPASCRTTLDLDRLACLTVADLPRAPTASQVSTVLAPWRTSETRGLAARILRYRQDLQAMVLRTHYGGDEDDKKWAEMMQAREVGDDGFELDDEGWTVLDNAGLFAFGEEWGRVFEVLPELSPKRGVSESGMRDARETFRQRLEYAREQDPQEWAAERGAVVERCAVMLQLYSVDHYLVVGDAEAFESDQFRVLFLDARNDIVRQSRIPAEDIGPLRIQVWRGAIRDQDCWVDGEVGEKYKVDGEIGQRLYAEVLSSL